ncbi:MAG: acyl-CoA dehydrogenase family protein [Candidatus Melainabacteria bacterium]|nr:acyl-CoA dehydrogenase family protein [Candidatus Melainabacteria bacterium]
MNTFLSSEQSQYQASCQAFVQEKLCQAGILKDLETNKEKQKEVLSLIAQSGLIGASLPHEYGGQGKTFLHACILAEELGTKDAGLSLVLANHLSACHLIWRYGTDEQKSRYLPLLSRGESYATIAFGEEQAGSDFSLIKTTAESNKLNGKKAWVVNGDMAYVALVLSRSSSNDQNQIWIVDLTSKNGVTVVKDRQKLGLKSASTVDIEFSSYAVDEKAALCQSTTVNEAIEYALSLSKVLLSAGALGICEQAIKYSVSRANEREQFGQTIGKFQAIQWKLADMSTETSAAKLLTYRAAWSKDEDPDDFLKFAAMCKLFAARVARLYSGEAAQIYGTLGISEEEPMEKLYRDAKVIEVLEGTQEIQKNIVASQVGA